MCFSGKCVAFGKLLGEWNTYLGTVLTFSLFKMQFNGELAQSLRESHFLSALEALMFRYLSTWGAPSPNSA